MQLPSQKTAREQRDGLWQDGILPSAYGTLPGLNFGGWQALLNALGTPSSLLTLDRTFTHDGDTMPAGHRKFVHPFGSVARVMFRSTAVHPYTGILAADAAIGLARLSLAGAPDLIGFTPGLALKIFVDGQPSLNTQAMHSLTGQGPDHNLFLNEFRNTLPVTPLQLGSPATWAIKALDLVFGSVTKDPRHLPVDSWAQMGVDGQAVAQPVAPFTLAFKPTAAAHAAFAAAGDVDFRKALAALPAGLTLYHISGDEQAIGELVLEEAFVASRFGDESLFFRHSR